MRFGLFFVGEYVAMSASSALIITLFLGGYQIPWLNTEALKNNLFWVICCLMVLAPLMSVVFARWIDKNNAWPEENDKRNVEARWLKRALVVINIVLLSILGTLLLLGMSSDAVNITVALLQIVTFALKLLFVNFFFIWVRWTLPRFRYDHLQDLGWKILLPLAIANIFFTGIFVVVFGA